MGASSAPGSLGCLLCWVRWQVGGQMSADKAQPSFSKTQAKPYTCQVRTSEWKTRSLPHITAECETTAVNRYTNSGDLHQQTVQILPLLKHSASMKQRSFITVSTLSHCLQNIAVNISIMILLLDWSSFGLSKRITWPTILFHVTVFSQMVIAG